MYITRSAFFFSESSQPIAFWQNVFVSPAENETDAGTWASCEWPIRYMVSPTSNEGASKTLVKA